MEFKWIYSKVEPVNILLRNFSFFHQTTGEKTDPKYILDREPNQQLYNWLKYNEADSASYLITGHRGAGKSSLVNYTIKQLIDENATSKKKNKKQYIKISISLGQEFLEEIEILRILARNLQEEFKAHTPLHIKFLKYLVSVLAFISKLIVISSLLIFAFLKGIDEILKHCNISYFCDILKHSDWLSHFYNTLKDTPYLFLIPISFFVLWFVTKKIYNSTHFQKTYRQIQTLCIRLNTTITDEEESSLKIKLEQWMTNIGISNRRKKVSPPASIQEIEFELIKIINEFQKKNQQLIIVFDELDKVDTNLRDMVNKKDSINPEFEKLSTRPEQHVSSRVRTQQVLKIVANMKYFLSTAKAYFIFIAGRELFEAFQADMCDRDFSISSIFNGVLNIESFLNGKSGIFNNSAIKTEEFVCRQLLPPNFQKEVEESKIYNPKMIYSLKNYYIFRNTEIINLSDEEEKKKQKGRIYQEIQFLYHFVNYLAFISNGSPKKITLFFEKYVRSQDYLENVEKIEFPQHEKQTGKDAKNTFYLSWGFRKIQKVNFIHYLTYPMIQGLLNRNSHSGDKLLISSSFLLTYILKLHNNGFSWRNLEQTPELQELNKTPEMRDYLSTFINFMNHNLVLTIPCGLYHYKFPMRIIEEISYHSRLSGEMSTLFNFSSTDLQGIKNQYIQLLEQNSTSDNKLGNSQYTVASTLHSLGDLYLLEENYSAAIRSYEQCLEIILPIFENNQHTTMIQAENYLVFTNRTMLKLGLAHEKRGTSNSAFILYDELIGLLKQMYTKEKYRSFFYDIRTIHLSILAKLFILEKIDTNGITPAHLKEAIEDFQTIIDSPPKKLNGKNIESKVIETDFYRKLGDILYYKNQEYKLNNKTTNALSCYLKSVEVLWNNDRLSSSNLNKTIKEITRNVSILKNELRNGRETSNTDDEKESIFLRDNEIYHLALSLESIGNVCLSTKSISLSTKNIYKINNFSTFCENFSKVITSQNKESELVYITRLNITNNFERAIICYWDAAHLYSLSCERGSSIKCYKNIVYTLLLYTRNQIKERKFKATNSNKLLQLMENLINHFLIHLHRQKEHIHLPEINYIQWLHSSEMYQPIPYESLSVTPDAEEILFLYYTTKLELWNNGLLTDDKQVQDLARFYQSPTMTGKNAYQTMFSSTLLLKLKARFNLILLNKLLNIRNGEEDFKQISFEKIRNFIKSEKTESKILKQFFNCEMPYSGTEEDWMNLLDTLIVDSIYCLARIQEQIIPIQNSMVFNNSFKADVFYNQFKMAVMYQYLYCYYRYTKKRKENIETFLKLVNGEKNANTNCLEESPSNNKRGKELYRNIRKNTHYNNQNCTNILFLGESCIHYYTKARQAHTQGKTYQEIIKNLYFLEDDLNNDCSPFHMAIERLEITTGHIKDREDKLKAILSKAPVYNGQTYFTSNLGSVK